MFDQFSMNNLSTNLINVMLSICALGSYDNPTSNMIFKNFYFLQMTVAKL